MRLEREEVFVLTCICWGLSGAAQRPLKRFYVVDNFVKKSCNEKVEKSQQDARNTLGKDHKAMTFTLESTGWNGPETPDWVKTLAAEASLRLNTPGGYVGVFPLDQAMEAVSGGLRVDHSPFGIEGLQIGDIEGHTAVLGIVTPSDVAVIQDWDRNGQVPHLLINPEVCHGTLKPVQVRLNTVSLENSTTILTLAYMVLNNFAVRIMNAQPEELVQITKEIEDLRVAQELRIEEAKKTHDTLDRRTLIPNFMFGIASDIDALEEYAEYLKDHAFLTPAANGETRQSFRYIGKSSPGITKFNRLLSTILKTFSGLRDGNGEHILRPPQIREGRSNSSVLPRATGGGMRGLREVPETL